jgi:hypothetical protein
MRRAPPVLWRGGRPPPCRRMKGPCLVWSPRGAPGVRSPRVLLRRRAPGHTVPAVAANMAELPNAKPRTPECKGEEKKGTPSSPRRRPAAHFAALRGGNPGDPEKGERSSLSGYCLGPPLIRPCVQPFFATARCARPPPRCGRLHPGASEDGAASNHLSICHRPAHPFRRAP